MQSRRINPVNLVKETLGTTGSVYIPSLIIASPGFLITLLSKLPVISPILVTISAIFLSPLLTGANIFYLHRHFSLNSISIEEAFNLSFQNIFKLIFASFVVLLICIIGLILFFFPGFYIMYRLLLSIYTIVIEDLFALDGITRSWQLTKGNWWSIFLATLLLTIVLFFPLIVLPVLLLSLGIPQQIASIVANILGFSIGPFFSVYGYLLYVNLKEN
ncbi:hypothetical protein [Dapis sp. BLCC M229]|uniref:hypothetical protein n=1 Tax=Dapis sp. BLCC M229 TaxID=3400188 RepID=UPI003CE72232